MKRVVYILTVIILLIVFGVSAFMVGNYLIESKEQKEKFDNLAQMKDQAKQEATQESTEPSTEATDPVPTFGSEQIHNENGILIEYSDLYAMNNDLVGWIRMANSDIDYPVMQTPSNPNYYLYRDFEGKDSARGCIYAREECDINAPSDNITLYGHNMKDGSMFAYLNRYVDKAAWDENPLIFFDTLYEYHVYKIFAVFKTTANLGEGFSYHRFEDAETEEEFDKFVSTCKDLSFYDTGITPVYGDKLITLSTCEYTLENGRLVAVAVRIS